MPSATSSCSIPFSGGFVGLANFRTLVARREFLERAAQHRAVDGRLGAAAVRLRPDPGAAAQPAFPRPSRWSRRWSSCPGRCRTSCRASTGPGCSIPSSARCRIGWSRSASARRPTTSCPIPRRALWGPIIANVWWGIPFFAITLLAALQSIPRDIYEAAEIDGAGAVRALPLDHVALPGADHRHHGAAARRLDRQCRRSDRRHDPRRAGRFDPDRGELHLHPGLPAARFRLRLGDRDGAARAAPRLCLRARRAAAER